MRLSRLYDSELFDLLRYEARSGGRSSPDALAFCACETPGLKSHLAAVSQTTIFRLISVLYGVLHALWYKNGMQRVAPILSYHSSKYGSAPNRSMGGRHFLIRTSIRWPQLDPVSEFSRRLRWRFDENFWNFNDRLNVKYYWNLPGR